MKRNDSILTANNLGVFNDVISYRKYFAAGANLYGEHRLFDKGIGYSDKIIGGEEYLLSASETNLETTSGIIPKGTYFVCAGIEIELPTRSANATQEFFSNPDAIIDTTPAGQDASTRGVELIHEYIRAMSRFELWSTPNDLIEESSITDYPPLSGSFGVTGDTGTTLLQNGGFAPRRLSVMHVLAELQQFYGIWRVTRQLKVHKGGYIDFKLVGRSCTSRKEIANVTGISLQKVEEALKSK